jgi:protein TonB
MNHKISIEQWSKLSGLAMVLALHGALLYAAMSYKLIPPPQEAVTLFVNLINPPKKVEPPPEPPKPPPKKVTLVKPQPVLQPKPEPVLVSNAPPPPVVPVPLVPDEPPAKPATVTLSSELSVSCPQRAMPNYPAASRRLNEQGLVVLRVELDETGHITAARVEASSGYRRLDEAGLAIVKTWHCNAATREGKAIRAVALQPFDFILEGR